MNNYRFKKTTRKRELKYTDGSNKDLTFLSIIYNLNPFQYFSFVKLIL